MNLMCSPNGIANSMMSQCLNLLAKITADLLASLHALQRDDVSSFHNLVSGIAIITK